MTCHYCNTTNEVRFDLNHWTGTEFVKVTACTSDACHAANKATIKAERDARLANRTPADHSKNAHAGEFAMLASLIGATR